MLETPADYLVPWPFDHLTSEFFKSGPERSSWCIDPPSNSARHSYTTNIFFLACFGRSCHDKICTKSFPKVVHHISWYIRWLEATIFCNPGRIFYLSKIFFFLLQYFRLHNAWSHCGIVRVHLKKTKEPCNDDFSSSFSFLHYPGTFWLLLILHCCSSRFFLEGELVLKNHFYTLFWKFFPERCLWWNTLFQNDVGLLVMQMHI